MFICRHLPSALGLLTYMPRQLKYDTHTFMIGEANDTKKSTGIALSHSHLAVAYIEGPAGHVQPLPTCSPEH